MRTKRNKYTILILVIFLISLIQSINYSYAQENSNSLEISSDFQMIEFSEIYGIKETSPSVLIDLPSPNWTLTDIDLNFTSIKMNSEIKIIEEEATGFETIRGNNIEILGMQMNITEPTLIYSVEIFGYKTIKTASPVPVYIRIEGWDSNLSRPNGVIYNMPIILNMTEGIPQWNKQSFQSPVYLSSGLYCLVLDGTGISWNDRYYWYINNDNPVSKLSMCRYDDILDEWQNRTGDVFLHRIKQKVNRTYFPSKINMTAEIGENTYFIKDGMELGSGMLSVENIDFFISGVMLNILIRNNLTLSLEMSFEYNIALSHILFSEGSGLIRENVENKWTILPEFIRISPSYSIKFYYPKSWNNLSVYRDGIDITPYLDHNYTENYIFISNNTIKEGATWLIYAYSPHIDFSLNIQKTKFEPLQTLKFSVFAPIIQGHITYVLIDALGYEEFRETKQVLSQETLFCCNISQNPVPGIYKAYLFWFNNTDAGIITQQFSIIIPFKIPLKIILEILFSVFIILVTSVSGYVLVKRKRRILVANKQKRYNQFTDILNLHTFILSEKNSGLTVYEQFFKSKNIDSSLISGFLQAVRAFGIELTEAEEQTRSLKLDYQNSKILMSDYKNIRIILIMEKNPSQDFLNSLNALLYDIEEKFGHLFEDFDGDITHFKEMGDLLDDHLHISLISPLKLVSHSKRLTAEENMMINKAVNIMKEKNTDHFFVLSLFDKMKEIRVNDAETILNLIQKEIFQPMRKKN